MQFPQEHELQQAAERIAPYVRRTPLLFSAELNKVTGLDLRFKPENLQHCGAFKFRGACNAVFGLDEETAKRGVTTHSSGNHAAALALAAQMRGIDANIVMPDNAPEVKQRRVRNAGATIHHCAPTLQAREDGVVRLVDELGAHVVHPYDDERIICGQSTALREALQDDELFNHVIAPVGGGGLLSGTALSLRYSGRKAQLWGAEPSGADDALRSLRAGHIIPSVKPDTIADGLLTSLGELTWPIIQQKVDDIIAVDDADIVHAMRLLWQYLNIIVEPSGAVSLAAALKQDEQLRDKRILIVISGGNVDLDTAFELFRRYD